MTNHVGLREWKKKRARLLPCPFEQNDQLLFLVFVRYGLDAAIVCGLRLCLFHRLLGLGGFLGARLGTLLFLFVENLFASQQLEKCLIRTVTFIPVSANDARVAAFPIAESPEARRPGPDVDNGSNLTAAVAATSAISPAVRTGAASRAPTITAAPAPAPPKAAATTTPRRRRSGARR